MLVFLIKLLGRSVRNQDIVLQFKDNKFYGLPFEVNDDLKEGVQRTT